MRQAREVAGDMSWRKLKGMGQCKQEGWPWAGAGGVHPLSLERQCR